MPRAPSIVLVLLLGLGLAACAQPAQRPATTSAPAQSAPSAQPAPPPKPKITAQQLLGKSDAWVLEKLGEPAFKRAERFASMWQYKNHACVLNVFLYADEAGAESAGPARVLHFDARDANGANAERDLCLSALQD